MRPRFNFAEAQVKNVKTDAIWQPTRHRQLVVAMYGGSYVVNLFKQKIVLHKNDLFATVTLRNNLSVIDSLTWALEERQGGLSPWILKIIPKKVAFLASSGKKQISLLLAPLRKILGNLLVPPLEKSFRGPWSLTSFTAQMAGCGLFSCWSYCVTITRQ